MWAANQHRVIDLQEKHVVKEEVYPKNNPKSDDAHVISFMLQPIVGHDQGIP